MSVTDLTKYARDPAAYVRRQFAELSARKDRECEQARKDARERELRREYVKRHTPETPDAA